MRSALAQTTIAALLALTLITTLPGAAAAATAPQTTHAITESGVSAVESTEVTGHCTVTYPPALGEGPYGALTDLSYGLALFTGLDHVALAVTCGHVPVMPGV